MKASYLMPTSKPKKVVIWRESLLNAVPEDQIEEFLLDVWNEEGTQQILAIGANHRRHAPSAIMEESNKQTEIFFPN